MHVKTFAKKLIIFSLAVYISIFSSISLPLGNDSAYAFDLRAKVRNLKNAIELKRLEARQKILELTKKEKVEVNKLYKSQASLENTKNDIKNCQQKLDITRNNLNSLEYQMNNLVIERQRTARLAGERLKQIYKGERITILHLIFSANDISTFLDRIYYQKRLAVYDKQLLTNLRTKTNELYKVKSQVEYQKNNILGTMSVMKQKKLQISAAINTSQSLINKLRNDRSTYESAERELERESRRLAAMLERKMRKSNEKIATTAGFLKPIPGILTSPFGWRRHPIFGSRSFHSGVDLAASYGTAVRASNSGRVIHVGWYGGYGKVVIINHGNYKGSGTSTLYAHLSGFAVSNGSLVKKGQVIAYEGTTGYSTGPHLHFEVRLNGSPTNPLNFIR